MANNFATAIWYIDTPSDPGVPFAVAGVKVQGFKWVSPGAAEDDAVIVLDGQGNPVWEVTASGANACPPLDVFVPPILIRGFQVPTLTSGRLYVYTVDSTV